MKTWALAAAAALTLGMAGTAAARDLPTGGLTAGEIADWLRGHGYAATTAPDGYGDTKVATSSQGVNWEIWTYGCDSGRCRSIQYVVGWSGNGTQVDKINQWDTDNRYIRAYRKSDGSIFGEFDVDLSPGGTWEQLDHTLDRWNSAFPKFKTYVGK